MHVKILVILLTFLAIGYSVAPSWVDKGVNLNYTVGNDTVSFTVLNRTGTDLKIEVKPFSASKPSTATENASANAGQIWFDNSLLAGASIGSDIGDFSVIEENEQTFAGKEWNTITLQGTIGGATTTRVYDKQTGLLLKQTVNSLGAPTVTLIQVYIPALTPPEPPSQPPTQPPTNTTTPPSQPPPSENTTQPPQPQPTDTTSEPTPPSSEPSSETPTKKPLPCCPTSLILLIIGFAAIRNRTGAGK